MSLVGTGISVAALIIVAILGLKVIKHVIITLVLIAAIVGILWYFGFIDISNLLGAAKSIQSLI